MLHHEIMGQLKHLHICTLKNYETGWGIPVMKCGDISSRDIIMIHHDDVHPEKIWNGVGNPCHEMRWYIITRYHHDTSCSQMPSRCLQWWWWLWWTFAYKHWLDIYIPTYTQKYNMTYRQAWITHRFTITSFLHNEMVVTKWHTWRTHIFTITSFCTMKWWAKWNTYTFAPWTFLKRGGESLSWNAVIYHHEEEGQEEEEDIMMMSHHDIQSWWITIIYHQDISSWYIIMIYHDDI